MSDILQVEVVARLLQLIADPPNVRLQPQRGDSSGPFTQWFDGGAMCQVGDYAVYEFADGSRAIVMPSASQVVLDLADGRHVQIQVTTSPAVAPSINTAPEANAAPLPGPPPGLCPRCGHVNTAEAQYCADCGAMLTALPVTSVVTPPVVQPAVPAAVVTAALPDVQPAVPVASASPAVDAAGTVGGVCGKCGTSNKTGARFCRTCGAQLA